MIRILVPLFSAVKRPNLEGMALPDVMEFNAQDAVEWEQRLRKIATELEEAGKDDSAKMMYAAAALMHDKALELEARTPEPDKYRN